MNLEQINHLENIQKAAENLNGVIRKTDLIYSEFFSKETGNRIYIKPENLQRTGSFKIRGAYNRIANLSEEERAKGIIASSAGNHEPWSDDGGWAGRYASFVYTSLKSQYARQPDGCSETK